MILFRVSKRLKAKLKVGEYTVLDAVKFKGGEPPSLSVKEKVDSRKASKLPKDPLVPSYDPDSFAIKPNLSSDEKETEPPNRGPAFLVGDRVKVVNLSQRLEYNGRIGSIKAKKNGRYQVELEFTKKGDRRILLNVKAVNLCLQRKSLEKRMNGRNFSKSGIDDRLGNNSVNSSRATKTSNSKIDPTTLGAKVYSFH